MKTLFAALLIFTSLVLFAADPPKDAGNEVHGCYSGRIVVGSEQSPGQKFAEYMVDDGSVILVAISDDKPFYVVPSERCSDFQDPK